MLTRQRQESLFVRDKSEQNISSFLEELYYIDWSKLDGYSDPKIYYYSKFLERYTKTYEKHVPLKKLKRRLHPRRPWIFRLLSKTKRQIDWDSATCITYSTAYRINVLL